MRRANDSRLLSALEEVAQGRIAAVHLSRGDWEEAVEGDDAQVDLDGHWVIVQMHFSYGAGAGD